MTRASEALHARGWREAFGLGQQVEAWHHLVRLVEGSQGGYTLTVDDYTNDLSVRAWLEEVRPLLTLRARAHLDARLQPLDARFRDATVAPRQRLPGAPDGRWWCRLPRLLRGELREDVVELRLLAE